MYAHPSLVSSSVSYKCEHFPQAVIVKGAKLYSQRSGGGGESAGSYPREGPIKEKRKLEIHALNSRVSEMEGAR